MSACIPGARFNVSILTLISTIACASSSTIPTPEIPSPQSSNEKPSQPIITERNSSKSWQLTPTSDVQHYSTTVTTTVQQSAAPTIAIDTVTTRTEYSLSLTRSTTAVSLTGSIQAFTVRAGARIGTEDAMSSFPVSFAGHVQDHHLQLDILSPDHQTSASSVSCETPAKAALITIERNLFVTPMNLRAGLTWEDSLSSQICSRDILLNLTILRTYKVIGEGSSNGTSAIVVDVTEKTLSAGEGSQDQHRIIVNSQATKTGHLYLDAITGLLLNLSSETQTTLQIQASGKNQQFLQISKETTDHM
jgi:hypothetical protein